MSAHSIPLAALLLASSAGAFTRISPKICRYSFKLREQFCESLLLAVKVQHFGLDKWAELRRTVTVQSRITYPIQFWGSYHADLDTAEGLSPFYGEYGPSEGETLYKKCSANPASYIDCRVGLIPSIIAIEELNFADPLETVIQVTHTDGAQTFTEDPARGKEALTIGDYLDKPDRTMTGKEYCLYFDAYRKLLAQERVNHKLVIAALAEEEQKESSQQRKKDDCRLS